MHFAVHDEQLVPNIPVDKLLIHDVPVDIICTPTQIIHTNTKIPKPTGEILNTEHLNSHFYFKYEHATPHCNHWPLSLGILDHSLPSGYNV